MGTLEESEGRSLPKGNVYRNPTSKARETSPERQHLSTPIKVSSWNQARFNRYRRRSSFDIARGHKCWNIARLGQLQIRTRRHEATHLQQRCRTKCRDCFFEFEMENFTSLFSQPREPDASKKSKGRGGTNRSDAGLNLSGSWQQGHSATYNTPSRI